MEGVYVCAPKITETYILHTQAIVRNSFLTSFNQKKKMVEFVSEFRSEKTFFFTHFILDRR